MSKFKPWTKLRTSFFLPAAFVAPRNSGASKQMAVSSACLETFHFRLGYDVASCPQLLEQRPNFFFRINAKSLQASKNPSQRGLGAAISRCVRIADISDG
jgi:hypothetical protein